MMHEEIEQQLTDYVLDLLPAQETGAVVEHLATCAGCRETVRKEREIGALVREIVGVSTGISDERLQRLMPAIPDQAGRRKNSAFWSSKLAPAFVLLLIIAGSILLWAPGSRQPTPLFVVATATATSTNTPTATITHETMGSVERSAAANRQMMAVSSAPVESPDPLPPAAAPTPIAATSSTTTSPDL